MPSFKPPEPLKVIRANLRRAEHVRAVVRLIDMYAADSMGRAQPLSAWARQRLIPGLRRHGALVLLGIVGRRAVGVAVCFIRFSTFSARPILNLHDLAVSSDVRGVGVGRALLQASLELARRRKCVRLTLEVRRDNRVAQRLYRRFGIKSGSPPYEFWTMEIES